MDKFKKPFNLDDLNPQPAVLELEHVPVPLKLRAFTLRDEQWMQKNYGDRIEQIFGELQTRPLCEILFHQLDYESQMQFPKEAVRQVDPETGEQITATLTPIDNLMSKVTGVNEKLKIVMAINETLGVSRIMQEELIGDDEGKPREDEGEAADQKTGD